MNEKKLKCILHAGMPKAGSSSIQRYLLEYGDENTHCINCNFGSSDSGFGFIHLFLSNPLTAYRYKIRCVSHADVEQYRLKALDYLGGYIERAHREQKALLFSWEGCWNMEEADLEKFRDYMGKRGFSVEIVIYIRVWNTRIESSFQQRIKMGLQSFQPVTKSQLQGFRTMVERFDNVFDSSAVTTFKYDQSLFPDGNIVRHFCAHIGIPYEASMDKRVNESISLPAVKLLYAFNKYKLNFTVHAPKKYFELCYSLASLKGPALRFHSDVMQSIVPVIESERAWLEHRLGGESIYEDITAYDDSQHSIRSEGDMFCYEPEALAWLAEQTGGELISPASGEEAALKVAQQMEELFHLVNRRQPGNRIPNKRHRQAGSRNNGKPGGTQKRKEGIALRIRHHLNRVYWPLKKQFLAYINRSK